MAAAGDENGLLKETVENVQTEDALM